MNEKKTIFDHLGVRVSPHVDKMAGILTALSGMLHENDDAAKRLFAFDPEQAQKLISLQEPKTITLYFVLYACEVLEVDFQELKI